MLRDAFTYCCDAGARVFDLNLTAVTASDRHFGGFGLSTIKVREWSRFGHSDAGKV